MPTDFPNSLELLIIDQSIISMRHEPEPTPQRLGFIIGMLTATARHLDLSTHLERAAMPFRFAEVYEYLSETMPAENAAHDAKCQAIRDNSAAIMREVYAMSEAYIPYVDKGQSLNLTKRGVEMLKAREETVFLANTTEIAFPARFHAALIGTGEHVDLDATDSAAVLDIVKRWGQPIATKPDPDKADNLIYYFPLPEG